MLPIELFTRLSDLLAFAALVSDMMYQEVTVKMNSIISVFYLH